MKGKFILSELCLFEGSRSRGIMLRHHRRLIPVGLVLTAGMLMLPVIPARANSAISTAPQLVSGKDPLPSPMAPGWCGSDAAHQDWEQEPSLSVNPTNGANLATAWIQDYDDAIVVGYTTDGGRSWANVVPRTNACTGGLPQFVNASAFDPSLAFGPSFGPASSQGIAYLTSVLCGPAWFIVGGQVQSLPCTQFAAIVNRSLDGGKTWSPPILLDASYGTEVIDGPSNVIADPARPGYAYAMWQKGDVLAATRSQYVSHTTDGGMTWSPPLPIPSSRPDALQLSGQLLVLHDGSLLDVVGEFPATTPPTHPPSAHGPTTMMATLSTDLGITWSVPVPIAMADPNLLARPSSAVAPDGTIYASWQRVDTSGSSFQLMYSKSADGGHSWQTPRVVAVEPGPLVVAGPGVGISAALSLAVAADGTVGVAFYDHRNAPPNSPASRTDYWFRYSHDGGTTWQEQHLGGPFDQTTAPNADGSLGGPGFLGDYQGIAPTADGFATTFAMAQPRAVSGPSDIFYVGVTIPGQRCGERDGDGDIAGAHHQSKATFQMDEDACEDNHGESVAMQDPDTGTNFHSTRITSLSFDPVLHSLTVIGMGVDNGTPVAFTAVAVDNGVPALDTFSLLLSDGYDNSGQLLDGIISLS